MPKLLNQLPKKCRDRNQAFSWHKGKRIYHGVWGSSEAEKSYKRFIAALLECPVILLRDSKDGDVLVSELADSFLDSIESRTDRTEFLHFKRAIGFLVEVYGELAVNEFSPKKLKVCRGKMVKEGTLCRSQVNKHIGKIIRIFAWGCEEEYVLPNIVAALREVKALRRGEQGTFDNPPRQEVPDDVIAATLPFLPPTVAAAVQVQFLYGMRPSEVLTMQVGAIDRSRESEGLWYYTPQAHKTERYIGKKTIPLGKAGQDLIAPYLVGKKGTDSVFSPKAAQRERAAAARANRKSKRTPSQRERDAIRAEKNASRVGEFYDHGAYRRAVQYAIEKGNRHGVKIPHWSPYLLRNSAATVIELEHGLDAAQAQLGHMSADMTRRYSRAQLKQREKLALTQRNPFPKQFGLIPDEP